MRRQLSLARTRPQPAHAVRRAPPWGRAAPARGLLAPVHPLAALPDVRINVELLMRRIHDTAVFGALPAFGPRPLKTGVRRPGLTRADADVRAWFLRQARKYGCAVTTDVVGNMFAVRAGSRPGLPTYMGSHLDTQLMGGRYDGILGVCAGFEVLSSLLKYRITTEFPVGVVNWTNEGGARFPKPMMGSGVWARTIPLDDAMKTSEISGGPATVYSELQRLGCTSKIPASYLAIPMAAHFELHIEQGPSLEAAQQRIGVVQGVQACRWYTVDVYGLEGHTGTTPLAARSDALLAAARMVSQIRDIAVQHGEDALASVGAMKVKPGTVNTIPGHVRFRLDLRAPRTETVVAVEAKIRNMLQAVAAEGGATLFCEIATDTSSPAVSFDEECINVVREAADAVLDGGLKKGLIRDMTSGAGHDSVNTSRRCPTGMIFVPSKNGISHHPQEFTSDADCELGANVLLQTVLRYDGIRGERARRDEDRVPDDPDEEESPMSKLASALDCST